MGTTIPVDPLSQAHEPEMSREVAIGNLVPESLNTGLEQCDHIHVFRMLDFPEEGTTLFAGIVLEANLGLEKKIQDVGVSEVEDDQEILPDWGRNM